MELPNAPHFSVVRVGAYRIRPPNGPAGDKDLSGRSIFRVIRSIDGTSGGRMRYAPTVLPENVSRFWGYNDLIIRKRITFWIFIFDE